MSSEEPPLIRLKRWVWVRSKLYRVALRRVLSLLCFLSVFSSVQVAAAPAPRAPEASRGFAQKPLLVATEMGIPEKELIAEQERQRRLSKRVQYTPGNTYSYGFCTWYVKNRRPDLPNRMGDARWWLANAPRTGNEPRPGAVVVTAESARGHVAYIEEIQGETMVVSEMNHRGWNIISSRRISVHSPVIRGYVY